MERWIGKVAVVTGAAGGIGSAVVRELIKHRLAVVGLDCDERKLNDLTEEIKTVSKTIFRSVRIDLTNEKQIVDTFKWIEQNVGPICVLINNAGIVIETRLLDSNFEDMNKIFQINAIAPIICAKEASNSMYKHNIDDGHIINMCSTAGRWPCSPADIPVSYSATKHALRIISDGLQKELKMKGSSIKVTNLCPGWVNTDLSRINKHSPKLESENIAAACISILQTAANVLIADLIIKSV